MIIKYNIICILCPLFLLLYVHNSYPNINTNTKFKYGNWELIKENNRYNFITKSTSNNNVLLYLISYGYKQYSELRLIIPKNIKINNNTKNKYNISIGDIKISGFFNLKNEYISISDINLLNYINRSNQLYMNFALNNKYFFKFSLSGFKDAYNAYNALIDNDIFHYVNSINNNSFGYSKNNNNSLDYNKKMSIVLICIILLFFMLALIYNKKHKNNPNEDKQQDYHSNEYTSKSNHSNNDVSEEIIKYLDMLELKYPITFNEIEEKYKLLILIYHPDKYQYNKKLYNYTEEKTKKLNIAFMELKKYFLSR